MKNRICRDLLRSWSQHTGVQIATLTVLVATFTVVSTALTASLNLQKVLSHWGKSVNVTVYLNDDIKTEELSKLKMQIEDLDAFTAIDFVTKEAAKASFEKDLSNILPTLLKDESFGNPFPASFELSLKEELLQQYDASPIDQVVGKISKLIGVDDVTYGQDWVKNYAALLNGVNRFGFVFVLIMLLGGVFVVGNGLRSAVAHRREEIEILELVGATYNMIRRPYVIDGMFTGFLSGCLALVFSSVIFRLGVDAMQSQISFLALNSEIKFLSVSWMLTVISASTVFGFFGSYLSIRQLNGGYSASKKVAH